MRGVGSVLGALVLCAVVVAGLSAQEVRIDGVSCDGTACPEPLELVDGRSVTITLRGTGLERLVSGQVVARRLAVQGVSVELGRVERTLRRRSLATRDVTVTARGTRALTGLGLRFATGAGTQVRAPLRLSMTGTTTAGLQVTRGDRASPETPTAAADVGLAITAPATALVGEHFTHAITITNRGPATPARIEMRIVATGARAVSIIPSGGGCRFEKQSAMSEEPPSLWCLVHDLAPGGSERIEIVLTARTPGTATVWAIAHPEDVEETVSGDNEAIARTELQAP